MFSERAKRKEIEQQPIRIRNGKKVIGSQKNRNSFFCNIERAKRAVKEASAKVRREVEVNGRNEEKSKKIEEDELERKQIFSQQEAGHQVGK